MGKSLNSHFAGESPAGKIMAPPTSFERAVVLVDACAGIGAVAVALQSSGIRVLHHLILEVEPTALTVLKAHWPHAEFGGDVRTVPVTALQNCIQMADAIGAPVLVASGFPCQDNSQLKGPARAGIAGTKSSLVWDILGLVKLLNTAAENTKVVVHTLLENVTGMTPADRTTVAADLGLHVHALCGGDWSLARRPRLFFSSWALTLRHTGQQ